MIEDNTGNEKCREKIAYERKNKQCGQEHAAGITQIIHPSPVEIKVAEEKSEKMRHEMLIIADPCHVFNGRGHNKINNGNNNRDSGVLAKIPDKKEKHDRIKAQNEKVGRKIERRGRAEKFI